MKEIPMTRFSSLLALAAVASATIALQAAAPRSLDRNCYVGIGDKSGTFRLQTDNGDCHGHRNCGSNMSDLPSTRFTGISVSDFANQGAHLTATLSAEAGTFTCTGTIKDSELNGDAAFAPNPDFVARMEKMGFTGYDNDKLLAYTLFDVQTEWVQSLQQLGIHGMDSGNLIAFRIFHIDPAFVHGLTSLGYEVPDADKLVSLSVQGVNADEVRQIRALGYQPTLDQLVQIRIFKVTPDFIRTMQARGFKNLTIEKLVQIRIFKLAD
jgi:hypothetical protein